MNPKKVLFWFGVTIVVMLTALIGLAFYYLNRKEANRLKTEAARNARHSKPIEVVKEKEVFEMYKDGGTPIEFANEQQN